MDLINPNSQVVSDISSDDIFSSDESSAVIGCPVSYTPSTCSLHRKHTHALTHLLQRVRARVLAAAACAAPGRAAAALGADEPPASRGCP